jgi:hypothetical protein
MSTQKTFPKETIYDFVADQALVPVQTENWRHGHRNAYVFEYEGSHWRVWIDVHHSDGWQLPDVVIATRVIAKQVTVTEWVTA